MKKFVAVLLVLVLVCSTVFCIAEDNDEAMARFKKIMENVTEIKDMVSTVEERINEYNERVDNDEELTDADILTYISYLKLYVSLKEVEVAELCSLSSEMVDAPSSLNDILEKLNRLESYLMDGIYTKDMIVEIIRRMAEGIGE